jgi:hypothetical protein
MSNTYDLHALDLAASWDAVAFDTVEDLKSWRFASEERRTWEYTKRLPSDFVHWTRKLCEYASTNAPAIDTSPLISVYGFLALWDRTRSGSGLPGNPEIETVLEQARIVVRQIMALARRGREDDLQFLGNHAVQFNGVTYPLTPDQFQFVKTVHDGGGGWRAAPVGVRWDRLRKRLPPAIESHIESKRSGTGGYRWIPD